MTDLKIHFNRFLYVNKLLTQGNNLIRRCIMLIVNLWVWCPVASSVSFAKGGNKGSTEVPYLFLNTKENSSCYKSLQAKLNYLSAAIFCTLLVPHLRPNSLPWVSGIAAHLIMEAVSALQHAGVIRAHFVMTDDAGILHVQLQSTCTVRPC